MIFMVLFIQCKIGGYMGFFYCSYAVSTSIGENVTGATTCVLTGWGNNGCSELYWFLFDKHTGNSISDVFLIGNWCCYLHGRRFCFVINSFFPILFISYLHQRVALSTVVNICKKLPSECPSPFMEAVPILCNLLQYEDPQVRTVKCVFVAFK